MLSDGFLPHGYCYFGRPGSPNCMSSRTPCSSTRPCVPQVSVGCSSTKRPRCKRSIRVRRGPNESNRRATSSKSPHGTCQYPCVCWSLRHTMADRGIESTSTTRLDSSAGRISWARVRSFSTTFGAFTTTFILPTTGFPAGPHGRLMEVRKPAARYPLFWSRGRWGGYRCRMYAGRHRLRLKDHLRRLPSLSRVPWKKKPSATPAFYGEALRQASPIPILFAA